MDPLVLTQQLGGAAGWTELRRHAVPRRAVESALRRGDLLACGRGGVCLPQARELPTTVAVRLGAVLSCGFAALHHGLELFGQCELHLTRATPGRGGHGVGVPSSTLPRSPCSKARCVCCSSKQDSDRW